MIPATVVAVVADGLARAGAGRVFDATRGAHPLATAAPARGLAVVEAGGDVTAGVMAAVTGDLTDAPGVALLALREGVGDAIEGLAHAAAAQAPLVAVVAPHDDVPLLAPAVKGVVAVEPASAAHAVAHAAQLALADPRGPVLLTLGEAVAGRPSVPVATACRPAELPPPPPERLDRAAAVIAAAARPVVLAGRQCDDAVAPWLRAFAEAVPAPVVTTPLARGLLPEPHPLALGVLGTPAAAPLLARADLVITLGVNDAELPPQALPASLPLLRVARRPAEAPPAATVEVVGDLALILEELAPRLRGREAADWDVAELDRLKRAGRPPGGPGFTARRVVEIAREATPATTLVAAEVGAIAWWQAVAPRHLLVGGGPGFALPAAVGARLAHPGRLVVCFATADGLRRHRPELAMAATLVPPLVGVALAGAEDAGLLEEASTAGWRWVEAGDERRFALALEQALAGRQAALIAARVRLREPL